MNNGQLPDFRSFIESRFHLSHRASGVDDGRVDPDIPASTVFGAICFALGLPSLLQCDQSLRTPLGHGWFGHGKSLPEPVVSHHVSEPGECGIGRVTLYLAQCISSRM